MSDNRSSALITRGLQEIPSEMIEPYLVAMLSIELEGIEFRPTEERLEEAKQNLRGVERFVTRFCGIHSRIAVGNVYSDFYELTLEEAKKIIKSANKEMYGN